MSLSRNPLIEYKRTTGLWHVDLRCQPDNDEFAWELILAHWTIRPPTTPE